MYLDKLFNDLHNINPTDVKKDYNIYRDLLNRTHIEERIPSDRVHNLASVD